MDKDRARTAGRYAVMLALVAGPAACADKTNEARSLAGADPARGLEIIERIGCASCHEIPGVRWPAGSTAAPLNGFGTSPLISGRLPNQPETLTRFLRNAPALDPETAMPPMPLSEVEARDVAAYLYTLR